MRCAICSARPLTDTDLQCASCARAALYPIRIRHAKVLLEREQASGKVEAAIEDAKTTSHWRQSDGLERAAATRLKVEEDVSQLAQARANAERITKHAANLREQMEEYNTLLNDRRKALMRRRKSLGAAKSELQELCGATLSPARSHVSKARADLDAVAKSNRSLQSARCKASALLAGLQRLPRRSLNGQNDDYRISGIPLVDLRQLNTRSPEEVNASLCNAARLLMLSCYYLQARLPAEIILPYRDHPHPSIMSPASSHSTRTVPSSPSSSSQSLRGSVKHSRELEQRASGRQRSLFLDRKLTRLAKEDSTAYALFTEGIALLAWDVAWLCRLQGLPVASTEWEDVCDLGHNLWKLLVDASPAWSGKRDRALKQYGLVPGRTPNGERTLSAPGAEAIVLHGTPQDMSLGGWRFARPTKIMHELKATLLAEMSGHDWELLDGNGIEEDSELTIKDGEEGVLVSGESRRDSGVGEGKVRGANGWMKVRGRNA